MDPLIGTDCAVDPSLSFESAYPLVSNTERTETICPRRDEDFFAIDVSGARQLLDIELLYQRIANLRLAVDVVAPTGLCFATSAPACDTTGSCSEATCDLARGRCRAGEPRICVADGDCAGGETCVIATEPQQRLIEDAANTSVHRIQGNVRASIAGTHFLKVYDHLQGWSDPETTYGLTVVARDDPDANELNDAAHLATSLASGTPTTGYLATYGDEDWYRIEPNFASEAVLSVELRWPKAAHMELLWSAQQEGTTWLFEGAKTQEDMSGSEPAQRSRATVVTPSNGPVLIRVWSASESYNDTNPYTLTVTVAADPSEPIRDDAPAAATEAEGTDYAQEATLVAQNDQDWYVVERDTSLPGTHSLIRIELSSPAPTTDYVLIMGVYVPTTTACGEHGECNAGGRCLSSDHTCLALWLQRPSPDGPGDQQAGGLTPNFLATQLPFYGDGPGRLYVLVEHNSATMELSKGFGDVPYHLALQQLEEPDPVDRDNPDNSFVARPLNPLKPALEADDYDPRHRELVAGTDYNMTPGAGTAGFAALTGPTSVSVDGCVSLSVVLFDNLGAPVASGASTTITLASAGEGQFYDDCGSATPSDITGTDITATGSNVTIDYRAPAGANLGNTVSLQLDGVAVVQALPIVDSAMEALEIDVPASTRNLPVGTASPALVLKLPSGAAATTLQVDVAGSAGVACADAASGGCPSAGVTTPCPSDLAGALSSCQVSLGDTGAYEVQLLASASGPVALSVSDPAGAFLPRTWVMAAHSPATLSSIWVDGMLSYDGDQDFFAISLGSFPKAGLTVRLQIPPSPLDVRIRASRGERAAGRGLNKAADMCGSCQTGASCDARNQCTWEAIDVISGVDNDDCVYLGQEGDLHVWVNDVNANDWDLAASYQFQIELVEGCPTSCDAEICGH